MPNLIFDDENDIIEHIQGFLNFAYLFTGNSLEKKVLRMLKDTANLIPQNSHSDYPPDYISPCHNMMFDVMRVNDTEIKKTYNPVKIRERKMLKELEQSGSLDKVNPDVKIICNSESDDIKEHSFDNYKNNVVRVTSEHLSSKGHPNKIKEIWIKNNPEIKYKGFLIFDETECCFDGCIIPAYADQFHYIAKKPLVLHEPWNDKSFIQWAYDSNIDFVIWACVYKPFGKLLLDYNIKFPGIMIMDVRYPRTEQYIDYRDMNLVL